MKQKFIISSLFMVCSVFAQAQKKADTLIIKIGKGSKVIFAIQDKKDLETLKHYNFQLLMDDMITKLDKRDTTQIKKPSTSYLKDTTKENSPNQETTVSTAEEWPTEADRTPARCAADT